MLAICQTPQSRRPAPGEPLTVGMVDLEAGHRYIPFDETRAWCWQQGTMLQWLGSAPDREVVYNGVDGDRYVAVVRDVHGGRTRTLPLKISPFLGSTSSPPDSSSPSLRN